MPPSLVSMCWSTLRPIVMKFLKLWLRSIEAYICYVGQNNILLKLQYCQLKDIKFFILIHDLACINSNYFSYNSSIHPLVLTFISWAKMLILLLIKYTAVNPRYFSPLRLQVLFFLKKLSSSLLCENVILTCTSSSHMFSILKML